METRKEKRTESLGKGIPVPTGISTEDYCARITEFEVNSMQHSLIPPQKILEGETHLVHGDTCSRSWDKAGSS